MTFTASAVHVWAWISDLPEILRFEFCCAADQSAMFREPFLPAAGVPQTAGGSGDTAVDLFFGAET